MLCAEDVAPRVQMESKGEHSSLKIKDVKYFEIQ